MQQQLLLYWPFVFILLIFPTESALSSGCGTSLSSIFTPGETTSVTVNATGDQPVRHYKVHLPASFKNTRGHAVVFSFHGHNGDMARQEDLSQLSEKGLLINGTGIIAVYPQGKAGTDGETAWQGAPYAAPGVDDIALVSTMISQLESTFCVDTARIYATGKSNGGGFVNLLACTPSISGKFAAFATVSAALYNTTFNGNCTIPCAAPFLDFHGTNDTVASYYGGPYRNTTLMTISDFRKEWALRDGCQSDATISYLSDQIDSNHTVEIQTWDTNCDAGGTVIGYTINGGQHGWPRTTLPKKCDGVEGTNDCSITVFDATADVIIPFFDKCLLESNE